MLRRFGLALARGLAALQDFVAEHGHARVRRAHRTKDGFDLGAWVIQRRHEATRHWVHQGRRKQRLGAMRTEELRTIHG